MVLMAYLAGLATLPAAGVGVWLGLRWWSALRRSEGLTDHMIVYPQSTALPPPSPQDRPTINRVRMGSIPASRSRSGRRR